MNQVKPLVSIIIPTYNGAKHISRTLESIIDQDYSNIEIIIVDDVSTDNTVEICQNILENSGRKFQIIKRTKNGRQSAARNTGLKAVNGKYIMFCDHDDFCEKNFVSSLCNEAEEKNVDLAFCGYKYFYEEENRYEEEKLQAKKNLPKPEDYLWVAMKNEIAIRTSWNFIFRKDFIDKHHLRFNERCYVYEDTEFTLKAIAMCSKISFIDKFLYIHVIHSEQQTTKEREYRAGYKLHIQTLLASWRIGRCITRHTSNNSLKNYVLYRYFADKLFRYYTLTIRANDFEFYKHIIRAFHHKKIRAIMLRFALSKPELLLKVVLLMYCPNFYYWSRTKLWK